MNKNEAIPKGQSIFLSNYSMNKNLGSPFNYPYIVDNKLPEDENWKDNETFGWISKEDVIKYFE